MPSNSSKKQPEENPYSSLMLDQQLCFALYTASNKIIRLYNTLLDPVDLTYAQYLVMIVLWESNPLQVGECAKALHLKFSTVTPVLKKLESKGLLTRHRDSEDERKVLVHLTAEGLKLRDKVVEIRNELVCRIDTSDAQAEEMRIVLRSLSDKIKFD